MTEPLRVLDLFTGLGGFSEAFRDRGHEVVTLDIEQEFKPLVCADIRKVEFPSLPPLDRGFDVVLASPPCEMFSLARAWHGWPPEKVAEALGVVAATFKLIAQIRPRYWVVENPRGFLRKYIGRPKETIFLCSYGLEFKKPTDLWGKYPGRLRKPCAPHVESPRGEVKIKKPDGTTYVGTRGGAMMVFTSGFTRDSKALRAKLPYGLSLELCRRIVKAMEGSR